MTERIAERIRQSVLDWTENVSIIEKDVGLSEAFHFEFSYCGEVYTVEVIGPVDDNV
jgi:hypothetical protein